MKTFVAQDVSPEVAEQYKILRAKALAERGVTDKPVTVPRVKLNSPSYIEFDVDPTIQQYR